MNFDWGNLTEFQAAELENAIQRAAETTATYTWNPDARSIFSPENLDYRCKLLVPTDSPIRNRLPRTTGLGEAASWLKMTSKLDPTATGTNTTIWFADAAEPSETSQTYGAASAVYKLLGRKIQVGVKAVAASRGRPGGLGTMFDERTNIKIVEVMLGEEQALIAGDSNTNGSAFDGLHKQITTNSGTMTFLTASGLQTTCFEPLYAAGAPRIDMVIANARQMRALADELSSGGSIQRIVIDNRGGVVSGARVRAVVNEIDGTEVETLVSRYVGATALVLNTRTSAGENCIEVEDLIALSAVDKDLAGLALTRYIFEVCALKVIHEPWQMKLAGLAT